MSRRSKAKYPALKSTYNTKVRQEYIDYDYLGKLSEEELEFLNKFTEETYSASFKKTKSKKNYSSKNLHKKKSQRQELYNENNRRNNDVYGVSRGVGMLKNNDHLITHLEKKSERSISQVEDDIIKVLDHELEPNED